MYNATTHLQELCTPGKRLCFYPSCGDRLLSPLTQLRSDVLVCADYFPRTLAQRRDFWRRIVGEFSENGVPLVLFKATKSVRVARAGEKLLFLFFQDNNAVLERITKTGWRIAQFVGLNDGCREGGNYECVHEEPFLSKLLPLMEDGGDYFADHSELLSEPTLRFSGRVHAKFRTHMRHHSGRHLFLSKILIIRGLYKALSTRGDVPDPEVFEPPVRDHTLRPTSWQLTGEAAAELAKLAPFRIQQLKGIIAHYHLSAPEAG